MSTYRIEGAQVFLPDGPTDTNVLVSDGLIAEIGDGGADLPIIDGRGMVLAPALVDVHGDAFERQIMPRPGVFFPMETAVLETDRQLAANGIATAYHAVTLGWEPGLREVARGRELIELLERLSARLTVENRVQLRWETFAFEAVDVILWALKGPLTPSLAFNDHTSMGVRDFEIPIQERAFEQSPTFATASFDDPRMRPRHEPYAKRAGMDYDGYMALMQSVWERRSGVDEKIRAVASAGRDVGAPMLSHDDTQIEARRYYREIGATVAEFPMTIGPTRDARAAGDAIIFGSPNVVRGGSHIGSLSAADMVEEGLCDALASDYYYPAMLAAVARLDQERRAPRPDLWALVSTGPARAMGLHDRGQIAVGQRADLVLADWPASGPPAIRTTFVEGRVAYQATPRG